MPRSTTAAVATDRPGPYMRQLCRHFGHKNEVTFDDERGEIRLASGVCTLDATRPDVLVLTATSEDDEQLASLARVIGVHLERFGSRDELSVSWDATG
jgi:hypothetical protein